jgi:hypothetical protein
MLATCPAAFSCSQHRDVQQRSDRAHTERFGTSDQLRVNHRSDASPREIAQMEIDELRQHRGRDADLAVRRMDDQIVQHRESGVVGADIDARLPGQRRAPHRCAEPLGANQPCTTKRDQLSLTVDPPSQPLVIITPRPTGRLVGVASRMPVQDGDRVPSAIVRRRPDRDIVAHNPASCRRHGLVKRDQRPGGAAQVVAIRSGGQQLTVACGDEPGRRLRMPKPVANVRHGVVQRRGRDWHAPQQHVARDSVGAALRTQHRRVRQSDRARVHPCDCLEDIHRIER